MYDIFNNYETTINRKTPKYIIIWLILLSIFCIAFILISIFYNFNKYEKYLGIVTKEGNDYYVKVYVKNDEIVITKTDTVKIDNETVKYQIVFISNQLVINTNNETCKEMIIKCQLKNNQKIENNILSLNFMLRKTTLFKNFLSYIKKGWNL